jgi:eukaryotic-like serine/threonine-protein kinase
VQGSAPAQDQEGGQDASPMPGRSRGTSAGTWVVLLLALAAALVIWMPGWLQEQQFKTGTPTPTYLPTRAPVRTQIAPLDGMVLVYVPEGEFLMGTLDNDAAAPASEKPQHTVYLDAYWIDQTEVTNSQYSQCVSAGVCKPPYEQSAYQLEDYYNSGKYGGYPVIKVDWSMADAYCRWAGRRLPNEAEWEKAARGVDGAIYPWGGQTVTSSLANYDNHKNGTTPVGGFPLGASPYGVYDMSGNVWEMVNDWFSEDYYSVSPAENPQGPKSGTDHVLRGGSWFVEAYNLRTAYRTDYAPDAWGNDVGFRCALSE